MSVEVSYYGKDGKERTFVLEEGDDTNLMFGGAKNNFTLIRSHYVDADGETRYEFWMKYFRYGAELHIHDFNPFRPSSRQIKVKFDSDRTAVFFSGQGYAEGGLKLHGWYYFGGPEEHLDGSFSLYRHLVKTYANVHYISPPSGDYDEFPGDYGPWYRTYNLVDVVALRLKSEAELQASFTNNDIALVSASKVAEVRDWEIVSNDTPEENTYYVVVENKKGDIVDVITTHGFGQTVTVGGKDYVVKYDMVIRPGR